MKRQSKLRVLLRMVKLVKPLTGFMALAILMGTLGFLCAQFIPILGGFARVHVDAGARVSVTIPLKDPSFTVVNTAGERIHDGRSFKLHVGISQPDDRSAALTGHRPVAVQLEF